MSAYKPFQWTEKGKALFLETLEEWGTVRRACKALGCSRSHASSLRATDDDFKAQWDEALLNGKEAIVEEARHRAMVGDLEIVTSHGQVVYIEEEIDGRKVKKPLTVRRKSDRLLEVVLRMSNPDGFAETLIHKGSINVTGKERLFSRIARIRDRRGSQDIPDGTDGNGSEGT